jgi:hypothetical protein
MVTVNGVVTASAKYGTKAGALAWWNTVAPGGKVPASWIPNGPPAGHTVSADGIYTFEFGQIHTDGSGYGNIAWHANPNDTDGGLLYVTWNSAGKASTPQTPDPGAVVPVGPFTGFTPFTDLAGFFAALSKLFDPALWKRVGLGAAGVAILVVALVLILRRAAPSITKAIG